MIQSKEELKEYIEYESHGFSNKFPDSIIGEPQNFQKLLRKTEYYRNCRKDIFGKIVYLSYRAKLERESQRLYGDYLRINNPHKTSLYLAAEKPVIIWKEAALANFVKQNHCGILISSLDEIAEAIKQLSDTEYRKIQQSTQEIGKKVRNGYYLKKAVKDIL